MKAWRGLQPGLENVIMSDKEPVPELTSDYDVLIKVIAGGLNPVDYKRAGWPNSKYPFTLGLDICGIVEKKGSKVDQDKFIEGKTVVLVHGSLANTYGYFADFAVHDSRYLSIVPDTFYNNENLIEVACKLAALPCASFTAYQAICTKLKLPIESYQPLPNVKVVKNILVSAGAGGVGGFCLQLLKLWRDNLPQDIKDTVKIITTCSAKNNDFVKKLGATHTIDYNQEDVLKKCMELSDNEGVDIFIDNVGGDNRKTGADALTFGGELVIVVEGESLDLNRFTSKAQSVHTIALGGAYRTNHHDKMIEIKSIGDQMLRLYSEGKIDPLLGEVISFEDIHEALKKLQDRHVQGKIVAKFIQSL